MDYKLAKKVGTDVVKKSGKILMKDFGRLHKAEFKHQNDIVTRMDIQSERLLMSALDKHFPDHSIISEESAPKEGRSKFAWTIDPIDGTINYFHGSPPFRVGLCLLENKKPIMSFIYNPHGDILHFAWKGKGAFSNGKRIHVSKNDDLRRTIVHTHISSRIEARARTLMALGSIFKDVLHIRVAGSGMAAATYVADAKFDVYFNINTKPWDIMPGALLVNEAGGKATEISGKAITLDSDSILATNGILHHEMLRLLKNV